MAIKQQNINKQELKIRNKERAIRYAMSLVIFQEVGIGPDQNLFTVRQTVSYIQQLCKTETGITLESYPVDYVKENKKQAISLIPFCLQEIKE